MTARKVVTLNTDTPQLEVPQAGDTYELVRDTNITGDLTITGTVDGRDVAADGGVLDTALQPADVGTAAAADTGDFATAAQGSTADSALQDITGESLTDLSDVDTDKSKTPADNDVLTFDGTHWNAEAPAVTGWADMTEAVWAGGTQSEVADGASAVAFDFDTDNAYSTAGANLARFGNNGTPVLDFSFQGGIDHVNSGASTAAHSQSLNLNWNAVSAQTSSGAYSAVIGYRCTASGFGSVSMCGSNTVAAQYGFATGQGKPCKF